MTQDEIIRMAREVGFIGLTKEIEMLERFAALVAEAEGKRLIWACEQARHPDEVVEWLEGFDACAAVLNAERIEL
jgi:hypothetical protein